MDVFTWPMAATAVGSIASICVTILKIVGKKNGQSSTTTTTSSTSNRDLEDLKTRANDLRQQIAVLNAQFADHKEDDKEEFAKVRSQIKDLTDLMHDLLTKLAAD